MEMKPEHRLGGLFAPEKSLLSASGFGGFRLKCPETWLFPRTEKEKVGSLFLLLSPVYWSASLLPSPFRNHRSAEGNDALRVKCTLHKE